MLLRISFSHTCRQLGLGSQKGHEVHYCPLVFAVSLTIFFPIWAYIQRLSQHLERQKRVGSVSSYRHCDCGFNEDVGVQNAEGEQMRCPVFFSFTRPLSVALRVGAYTSKRESEKSMKICQTWLAYLEKQCSYRPLHVQCSLTHHSEIKQAIIHILFGEGSKKLILLTWLSSQLQLLFFSALFNVPTVYSIACFLIPKPVHNRSPDR